MDLPDLWLAFRDGAAAETTNGPVTLRCHAIEEIVLTTGKVVACDPMAPSAAPFTVTLPPGKHPVMLTVARFEDGDERIAFATVRVADEEPDAWEMALRPGENGATLQSGQYFGYPTDSGGGGFMDLDAAEAWAARVKQDLMFPDFVSSELDKHYTDTWDWAVLRPDDRLPANVVVFAAGVGDGFYGSFFGRDAGGKVVCLLTDFNVIDAV